MTCEHWECSTCDACACDPDPDNDQCPHTGQCTSCCGCVDNGHNGDEPGLP